MILDPFTGEQLDGVLPNAQVDMPMQGMPMQGMPIQGMPMQGMDYGMSMQGMPMQGMDYGIPMQGMDYGTQYATQGFLDNQYIQQQLMQMLYNGKSQNKAFALDCLRAYVVQLCQVNISSEVKLEETPNLIKHACLPCKVSRLPVNQYTIPEFGISIPFYFCKGCGKLYYMKDFM